MELRRDGAHERRLDGELGLDVGLGAVHDVLAEHERGAHDLVDRCALPLTRRTRVADEVLRQLVDAPRAFDDLARALEIARRAFFQPLTHDVLAVDADRRQRVVELVHHAGRELAERGQLLGLTDDLSLERAYALDVVLPDAEMTPSISPSAARNTDVLNTGAMHGTVGARDRDFGVAAARSRGARR